MRVYIALTAIFVFPSHAQLLTGVVSDQKTNESLSYVHIGVAGKNMGVISRDDGSYEIDISKAERADVLVFSIIGYENKTIVVQDLKPGRMDVSMAPRTYQLKEVIVRESKEAPKTEKLGRFTPTKTTMGQSGLREFGFGGEWGVRINAHGKKYLINNVQVHMRFNTVDSILFRFNFYKVDGDMPGESVLTKDIFTTSKKKQKWIVRDLIKENIVLDQDLIVTYEVVRVWFKKSGENRLFFTHGSGYEEGRSYFRGSSQDTWTVDQHHHPTLYLTVEEF